MNEENENASAWDSLIGELGVEVNPEALERKQPSPQQVSSVAADRHDVPPPAPAPSDWGALASSLGLEVPPEDPPRKIEAAPPPALQPQRADRPREERSCADRAPDEKQPRGGRREERADVQDQTTDEPASEQPPVDRPRRGRAREDRKDRGRPRRREQRVEFETDPEFEEVVDEIDDELANSESTTARDPTESGAPDTEKPRISGEAARSAFDALFSAEAVNWGSAFVSPRTNVESSFLFAEGEEAVFAEDILDRTDIDEEDDNGEEPKKRRRRRRGGRGRGRGRGEGPADAADAEDELADDASDAEDDLTADDTADDAVETEEAIGEPDKRRRRRRGRGGRRRSEDSESTPDEGDESHARRRVAAHIGEHDDDDADEDAVEADEGSRGGHRNLPTWNDAIGVIVESNLAHRSKSPAKQQNQSRGRGRGGRRHKK